MIQLPKQWSDVTLDQFIDFNSIDKSLGSYHYNSEAISILSNEPVEVVEDMDVDELTSLIRSNQWCASAPSSQYKTEILGLKFKPFNKLTLYEYIDLDYYFGQDYISNLDKVCAILYRHTKINEWGDEVLEPYIFDCIKRSDIFLDIPITEVYGIIPAFMKFRDNFIKTYENLFMGEADEPLTNEERSELDPEEIKEIEKEEQSAKWSWELMIYSLSKGDITKSDKIGQLPLVYVFNMLGMKKELDI